MNYFMGQGKLYAAIRAANGSIGAYRFLGNCTRFDVLLGAGAVRFADKSGPLRRVGEMPRMELDLESFSATNLAALLYGDTAVIAAGTVTETIRVYRGKMTPLGNINITEVQAVTNAAGQGFDPAQYTIDSRTGSFELPANSTIPDGTNVTVKYAHAGHTDINAFTQKQPFLQLRYDGVNTVDYAPAIMEVFKTKFDPVDSLSLIGDNFSSMKVTGRVYADDSLVATRSGQRFLRVRQT